MKKLILFIGFAWLLALYSAGACAEDDLLDRLSDEGIEL